jgi:FixJ family two-component response regulator
VAVHIVEDDPSVCDSLLLLVRHLGFEARGYPDAESFMREVPPAKADTIIVDLLLPGLSGAGVIRWLQSLPEPPRIIAMTGQPLRAINREVRDLGLETLLRKPLSQETLTAVL